MAVSFPMTGDDFFGELAKALGLDPLLPIMEIAIAVKPGEIVAAVVTIEMDKSSAAATLDIIRRAREQPERVSADGKRTLPAPDAVVASAATCLTCGHPAPGHTLRCVIGELERMAGNAP